MESEDRNEEVPECAKPFSTSIAACVLVSTAVGKGVPPRYRVDPFCSEGYGRELVRIIHPDGLVWPGKPQMPAGIRGGEV